jgi:hypothetical protein
MIFMPLQKSDALRRLPAADAATLQFRLTFVSKNAGGN